MVTRSLDVGDLSWREGNIVVPVTLDRIRPNPPWIRTVVNFLDTNKSFRGTPLYESRETRGLSTIRICFFLINKSSHTHVHASARKRVEAY